MLSDTWAWDKQFSKLWQGAGSYNNWQRLCGEPEALLGMQTVSYTHLVEQKWMSEMI